MDNERLAADAVALYSSVHTFLRRFRSEIDSACTKPGHLDLLDPLGQLADAILHGDALMDASRTVVASVPDSLDLPTVVAHVARLRECIISVWEREIGPDHPAALRAVHNALDRTIQLVVERDVTVAKLEGLLAASPVGIAFLDRDMRYVRINDALARMNGHSSEAHLGRTVREVLPEAAAYIEPRMHEVLATGSPVGVELDACVGTYFPVRSRAGAVVGIGCIALDVSDRKAMENELRQAVRQREDLIAVVSHDLRNPLGTITLGSTLIATDLTLSAPSRRHVEMIHRSARRMERLIDDLLDMAQIQLGRLSLHLERIPAEQAVRDAVESLQVIALEKRILLTTDTRLAEVEILVDAERLQRVFSNLIGNAIKFCAAGDEVRVAGEVADGTHVRFCVEDSGPGIEPDALPCLFDPYWSSPDHARRGVGLGLFICHGIITAHGGTIAVESEVGRGTTFHIVLPIAR